MDGAITEQHSKPNGLLWGAFSADTMFFTDSVQIVFVPEYHQPGEMGSIRPGAFLAYWLAWYFHCHTVPFALLSTVRYSIGL
jgi:hypothetical protein